MSDLEVDLKENLEVDLDEDFELGIWSSARSSPSAEMCRPGSGRNMPTVPHSKLKSQLPSQGT